MKEITLEDVKKYIVEQIAFITKKPSNYVVTFRNVEDKTMPIVKSLVKCVDEEAQQFTARITSVEESPPISEEADVKFKSRAIKTISSLCCNG